MRCSRWTCGRGARQRRWPRAGYAVTLVGGCDAPERVRELTAADVRLELYPATRAAVTASPGRSASSIGEAGGPRLVAGYDRLFGSSHAG